MSVNMKELYDQSMEYTEIVMDDVMDALSKENIEYTKHSDTEISVSLKKQNADTVMSAIHSNIKTPKVIFSTLVNLVTTDGVIYIRQVLK